MCNHQLLLAEQQTLPAWQRNVFAAHCRRELAQQGFDVVPQRLLRDRLLPAHINLIVVQRDLARSIILSHYIEEERVNHHFSFCLETGGIAGVWRCQTRKWIRLEYPLHELEEVRARAGLIQYLEPFGYELGKHGRNGTIFNLDETAIEVHGHMGKVDRPSSGVNRQHSVVRVLGFVSESPKVTIRGEF